MKPIISALFTCGDEQPVWMPIPVPSDRENVMIFSDRLSHYNRQYYTFEDEKILAYRSSFGVTPDTDMPWYDVDSTAKCLLKFTPEQLACIKTLCDAFGLTFKDIDAFISFLCDAKGMTLNEICENGIKKEGVI